MTLSLLLAIMMLVPSASAVSADNEIINNRFENFHGRWRPSILL